MFMVNQLIGFGSREPVWTTVWSGVQTTPNTGFEGYAFRIKPSSALSGGGNFVRVTFQSWSSGGNMTVDHASIGILGGATFPSMTTNPPVELKFSGVSGFDIASGSVQKLSDTTQLSFLSSDTLVIDLDFHSTGGNIGYFSSTGSMQSKAASADYNNATVSGYSSSNQCPCIVKIEAGN